MSSDQDLTTGLFEPDFLLFGFSQQPSQEIPLQTAVAWKATYAGWTSSTHNVINTVKTRYSPQKRGFTVWNAQRHQGWSCEVPNNEKLARMLSENPGTSEHDVSAKSPRVRKQAQSKIHLLFGHYNVYLCLQGTKITLKYLLCKKNTKIFYSWKSCNIWCYQGEVKLQKPWEDFTVKYSQIIKLCKNKKKLFTQCWI